MEKKTLKLTLTTADNNHCEFERATFEEPLFAFTSTPKQGKIECKTDFTYCRESICEYIRQDLRAVSNYGVVISKLHMAVYRRVPKKTGPAIFKNQILAGQNLVNTIEAHYGWPLTKIYSVKVKKDITVNNQFYYISAGKRWIKAPAMLSLFTLLFRIAAIEKTSKFSHKITSFDTMFDALGELAKKNKQLELSYFSTHGHCWESILDHYRILFGKREIGDLYSPGHNEYYFTEGINTLCDGDSKDYTLAEKFYSIQNRPNQLAKIRKRLDQI